MKIGVISDTHLEFTTPLLERVVKQYFEDVELVLHAGDVTTPEVLEAFKGKELIVVAGNMDTPEIKGRFPYKMTLSFNGFIIGLTHGSGSPFGIVRRIRGLFRRVDCIVFGHTHMVMNKRVGDILFFNPGSFRACIPHLWRRTIGILDIKDKIEGRVIHVSNSLLHKSY